jgi:hypothetical protein
MSSVKSQIQTVNNEIADIKDPVSKILKYPDSIPSLVLIINKMDS